MFFEKRNKSDEDSFTDLDEVFSRHAKSVNILPRPGFKEALFARLNSVRQTSSMSTKTFFRNLPLLACPPKPERRRAKERVGVRLVTAGLTVLVVAVISTMVFQPFFGVKTVFAQDNFVLTAEQSDSLGVEPDTSFILESKDPVKVDDIKDKISLNTEIAFDMEQVSENKIRLVFAAALPVAKVVTFSLASATTTSAGETVERPYYWAFQVKSPFKVTGTIPGEQTTEVALDSGIEVNFNYENVSLKDFEKAFSVMPKLKGHFEQSRRTFVFVPEEGLQPRALYTVTISGSLGLKGSDDTLGKDYVFSFETASDTKRGARFSIQERYLSINPSDKAVAPYSAWRDDHGEEKVQVEIRQFISKTEASDFQQYLLTMKKVSENSWLNYTPIAAWFDVSGLPVVMTFEAESLEVGWQKMVVFPDTLPRGYYLADFTFAGLHRFVLIESSQITAYAVKAVNETLVWVNSAETSAPISGAAVSFVDFDEASAVTGEDGLASIPVSADWTAEQYDLLSWLEVRSGSEAIILPLEENNFWLADQSSQEQKTPILSASENYWTYLYTDRPMYQLTDTVKFWGYISHRDNNDIPKNLRATISQGGQCSYGGCFNSGVLVYDESAISVSETGFFSGELKLGGVSSGNYDLSIQLGDELITERGFNVSEYVKPAYTLSVTPDAETVWTGETIGYTVHGEFFEGTPVKGLKVSVEFDGENQELTLDEAGNARGSFKAQTYEEEESYPVSAWFFAAPARPEEAGISAEASIIVFGPKVYLDEDRPASTIKDGVGTIKLTTRQVQAIASWEPEIFAPTVRSNQVVTGSLFELTYNKTESGAYYDFIKKLVVKKYHYTRVEKKIADLSLISNEKGEIIYTFAATNPEANYKVELSAKDENGLTGNLNTYLWRKYAYNDNNHPYLYFKNLNAPEDEQSSFPGYKIGDAVNLQVQKDEATFVPETKGKFLFFQAQRGLREKTLQNAADYNFTFNQEDLPGISVYGVYFSGSAYAEVGDWGYGGGRYAVNFDNRQKELRVSVKADKENYRPGDEVALTVETLDQNNQAVAAGVNLNVVDEAFYALMSEEVNPLDELYENVYDGVIATKVSSRMVESMSAGAEKGGGGERGRVAFKDTADFVSVITDKNGQASYKFILPDNITSWRVTAQAIEPENKMAGDTKIDLNASLPFFVTPVMRESYLVDDQPEILIRAAGTDISTGSSVEYLIKVPDAQIEEIKTALANETVLFSLPKLSEGSHEITITGTSGNLKDTITRSVKIVQSRLVEPIVFSTDLNQSSVINGSTDGLTYVTFAEAGRGRYYDKLERLARKFGDRADEVLTRTLAAEMLNEYFGTRETVPEISLSSYQESGIRLLSYADEDFDLSTKVAMLGETPFEESDLINYFSDYLYSSREAGQEISAEEAAKAYAGLAGLGEPVLAEVQRLADEEGLGRTEKLYLAMAMYLSGDGEGARAIYRELLKDLTEEFGYAYLPDKDLETQGEQTALMAVLAGGLREDKRDALFDYIIKQHHGDTLLVLDQVLFLKETLKTLIGQAAEIEYFLAGERRTAALKNNETLTLPLSVEELAGLNPAVKNGAVTAISRYDSPVVSLDQEVDSRLILTRKYSAVDGSVGTTFKSGDLIQVDITYNIPKSGEGETTPQAFFEITDVVPSGLAVMKPSWQNDELCQSWPNNVENQSISFFVGNGKYKSGRCPAYTLIYYARVVTPGTYVAEPTFIRSVRAPSEQNHLAESTIITIGE